MAPRRPYPLQWPKWIPRTLVGLRTQSKFGRTAVYQAACDVLHELDLLGTGNVVITSELPTRNDGIPYSDGRAKNGDVGIAIWFDLAGNETVFACDRWLTAGENLRAIALSVGAMRGLERWGMPDVVRRAVAGFAALPPGSSGTVDAGPIVRPWREVLGGEWPPLDRFETLAIAKSRHRRAIEVAHPDRGGDATIAAELNVAIAEAESELTA